MSPYRERKFKSIILDVGDFSLEPGGRFDCLYSGEEYRKNILIPAVQKYVLVTVNLDMPFGFTSSFLEEVFGGIVREYGKNILNHVKPISPAQPNRSAHAKRYMKLAVEKLLVKV